MSCIVAYELENKNPKVKIATLHPVMGKILVCTVLRLHGHIQKKMLFTNDGEVEHI